MPALLVHWRVAPIALAIGIGGNPAPDRGTGDLEPRSLETARQAARWIARQAVPAGEGRVEFPEYAEAPDERPSNLYAGSAGVLVFLENAAAILEDPALRDLADRAAARLLEDSRQGDGGPGLYTGDAGIGHAFLVRARLRDDEEALGVAERIADGLLARARSDRDAASWDEAYDVIDGAAGTVLFLLEVARDSGEERYLRAALAGAKGLARAGIEAAATREGPGRRLWWPARAGTERHYPNFSHGTGGVAYALARVAAATEDEECEEAAIAGGRWLLDHAKREDGTLCWYLHTPGREDGFFEGWCHGPAGTARLFLALASLTGDAAYGEAAREAGAWIRKTKPSPATVGARFYSPSLCCGAAGVLDFFVDLYRAFGAEEDRAYALEVGEHLRGLSKEDGDGRKWTNYDRPDEKGLVYHGVSLMLGASGHGLAFLRLAAIDRETDPVVHLPDRSVLLAGAARAPRAAHSPQAQRVADPGAPPLLETKAETPGHGHKGSAYVVLTNHSEAGDPYHEAAAALARWRKGHLVTDFDPREPERIAPVLRELGARFAALVLAPEDIDTNTQRRFLMAAARLDDDIFVDVAFGYVTGTPATPPLALVERAKRLELDGIARRWVSASVASQIRSTVYPGAGDPTAARAGFEGRKIYWGAREADPDVLDFVDAQLPGIEPGGVVTFSGCGDPEGIWLFSDERNRRREKHWAFDPRRVGADPDGEMPRIGADRLARARLDGAVVWSGVCHTGSFDRVFVGADIVSTFGATDGHTEYRIPPKRSLAAAFLDAGAAALVAPVGSNHGYRNLVEAQEALERRLALGDALRSTYDDVAMSQGRAPVLDLHLPDAPRPDRGIGAIMGGGGANRVLYGDPALSPFRDVDVEPAIAVLRRPLPGGGFEIEASVAAKDWWSWDMFAGDLHRARIRAIIDLEDRDPRSLRVTAEARGASGERIPAGRLDAAVEWIDGGRRLHLQVAAPRESKLGDPGTSAVFRVVSADEETAVDLAYRIERVPDPELRVDVHLRVKGDEDGATELGVEERWGGVSEGGRDVSELVARGEDGRSLEVERQAPHRWSVRHAPAENLELVYRLPRNDHQGQIAPGTHRRPIVNDAVVAAMGRLFLVVPAHLDREVPRTVSIEWSGFGEDAGLACSFGVGPGPHVFETSLERLVHSVFLGGDVRVLSRTLEGGTVWLAADERGFEFDVSAFADLVAAIAKAERAFFGDRSPPFFLVTLIPVGEAQPGSMSFGGTGLTDSFALAVQPGPSLEPGSEGYRRIATLLAHEMFHDWNGTLLRREEPEELCYWFSEGFTDFYARRLLLRAGLASVDETVASLNGALRTLFTSPVRAEPNERIRADYWNDPDVQRLPYTRGDAAAMVLDHAIRERSGGARSLDDLVRELVGRGRAGWKVSTDKILVEVARWASPEVAESIRNLLEGALPALDPETFAPCLRLETVEVHAFDVGFDLEASMAAKEVRGVRPGGPADAAGLRNGQALRGWSVRRGDVANPVRFQVVVDGEERSVEYLPRGAAVPVPQFVRDPAVEDAACRL